MKTEKLEVSNRTLLGQFTALSILGNRSMGSTLADLKVGRLLHHLTPVCEPIGPARQRIVADMDEIQNLESLTGPAAQIMAAKIEVALDDFDSQVVEVDMPTMRITQDDLPKEKPGDDGWRNAAQLGAITSNLGVLFEFPEEPKE